MNLLFPSDSHIAMAPSQGSMVSGSSSSISVNTPGFDVDPPPLRTRAMPSSTCRCSSCTSTTTSAAARLSVGARHAPTPPPAQACAPAVHPSVLVPVLTVDQGVPMKLIVAVTLACLVGSLIFWFAVF